MYELQDSLQGLPRTYVGGFYLSNLFVLPELPEEKYSLPLRLVCRLKRRGSLMVGKGLWGRDLGEARLEDVGLGFAGLRPSVQNLGLRLCRDFFSLITMIMTTARLPLPPSKPGRSQRVRYTIVR